MATRHMISRAVQLFVGSAINQRAYGNKAGVPMTPIYVHSFASPAASDADGFVESQDLTAAGVYSAAGLAGALTSNGVGGVVTPRNVVAAWTGAAIITVTGTDQYGETLKESSASGTTFAGKKAFKTVTSVAVSANVTGLTVGTGDVLGLPFRVATGGVLFARAANAIDAGTFVAADTTDPATATTGDVRGTFDPSAAIAGGTKIQVGLLIADISSKVGAYGVAQYAG